MKLEQACIDTLFFADVNGVYNVSRGSADVAMQHAVQTPSIDPVPSST